MVNGDAWVGYAATRASELPPDVRHLVAGLYRFVVGTPSEGDDLAAALADGLDPDVLSRSIEVLVAALGLRVWSRAAWRRPEPAAPSGGDAARLAAAHYAADGDAVPEPVRELARRYPELTELFIHTRQSLLDGGGLDPAVRELLLGLLSAQGGYLDGGRRHVRRALDAGLPPAALSDALTCALLTHGAAAWEAYGRALWEEAGAGSGDAAGQ
jgi:alkylhydroperoxidase/carboxymuconolactone decarboxylase family protein YurZ